MRALVHPLHRLVDGLYPVPHSARFDFAATAPRRGVDRRPDRATRGRGSRRRHPAPRSSRTATGGCRTSACATARSTRSTTGRASPRRARWARSRPRPSRSASTGRSRRPAGCRRPPRSAAFAAEYADARGAPLTDDERDRLARQLVVSLAYGARCEHADDGTPPTGTDSQRALLAALGPGRSSPTASTRSAPDDVDDGREGVEVPDAEVGDPPALPALVEVRGDLGVGADREERRGERIGGRRHHPRATISRATASRSSVTTTCWTSTWSSGSVPAARAASRMCATVASRRSASQRVSCRWPSASVRPSIVSPTVSACAAACASAARPLTPTRIGRRACALAPELHAVDAGSARPRGSPPRRRAAAAGARPTRRAGPCARRAGRTRDRSRRTR